MKQLNNLKKLFALIMVSVVLFSCNNQLNKVAELQKQVDSLKINSYKPGLGEFMNSIQTHHIKIWFAGKNENWKLADFEMHEIKEALDDIKQFCADRPEVKSLPLIIPALDSLNQSIQQKNQAEFIKHYIVLTNTCNECHQVTEHGFNAVKVPDSSPFTDQTFTENVKK